MVRTYKISWILKPQQLKLFHKLQQDLDDEYVEDWDPPQLKPIQIKTYLHQCNMIHHKDHKTTAAGRTCSDPTGEVGPAAGDI
jgi:hypothetical protein